MTTSQPYMNHRMPLKMGMDRFDWEDIEDRLNIANEEQLRAVRKLIDIKLEKRR